MTLAYARVTRRFNLVFVYLHSNKRIQLKWILELFADPFGNRNSNAIMNNLSNLKVTYTRSLFKLRFI